MTKITQAPFITPSSETGFVVTESSAIARVHYNDLLQALESNLQGVQGPQGSSTGDTGAQGTQGIQGPNGTQGITGRAIQGSQGTSGSAVAQGAQGSTGVQGRQGIQGSGTQGTIGSQGTSGSAVAQGAQGVQGVAGPTSLASDTQILYNDGGTVTGDAVLTWNKTSKTITVGSNSTNGSTLIKGYYSNGALTVLGTEYASGGPILGYAVTPSTSAADAFLSATNSGPLARGAYIIAGMTHKWYSTSSQTIASGSAVSLTKMMYLDNTGLTINGNLTVTGTSVGAIPTGGIIMWTGVSLPSGWYLCDGTNGTPDLRDKFIVGAGSTYSVGNTGGSKDAIVVSHTHAITDPAHRHLTGVGAEAGLNNKYGDNGSQGTGWRISNAGGTGLDSYTNSVTTGITVNSAGASGTNANLPPYYALAFIMKG